MANFTNKGPFTSYGQYFSACENSCITSVALEGSFFFIKDLHYKRCILKTWAFTRLRRSKEKLSVALWKMQNPVFLGLDPC